MAKKWTDEEIQFLKFAYPSKDFDILAASKELDRSTSAIRDKAHRLGLKVYKEDLPVGTRRCCRCKILFPINAFYSDKNDKDGYSRRCKECDKERMNKVKNKDAVIDNAIVVEKLCPKCGEVKSFDSFHKNKNEKFGLSIYCKVCRSKIDSEYKIKKLKERGW